MTFEGAYDELGDIRGGDILVTSASWALFLPIGALIMCEVCKRAPKAPMVRSWQFPIELGAGAEAFTAMHDS